MKDSQHRHSHIKSKSIRKANQMAYEIDPKEPTSKQKKRFLSTGKNIKWAKGRKNFRHSRQTSPKDVTWHTEPEGIHQEGLRWIQNIRKQTAIKTKKILRKFKKQP